MDLRSRLAARWPLFGLAVRTPRLELRYPTDDDLLELAELSVDIHEPGAVLFAQPWNVGSDDEVRTRVLQYHWGRRGDWTVDAWRLELVTVVDGRVVGTQGIHADDYPVTRTVVTGSWLGRAHQGHGIGTEMRQAALHLAFAGLGAERAETEAFEGNPASLRVTERLGYEPNGDGLHASAGVAHRQLKYVLLRSGWERRRRPDIELVGLEPCRPLFGLA